MRRRKNMKLNNTYVLMAALCFCGCATKPETSSISNVLSNPKIFNGKAITVEGFVYLDVETRLVCTAPEELYQCLWLHLPGGYQEIESKYKIETGSKIIVSGIFHLQDINADKNTMENGVMIIRFGPYWH